jgi:hypothetical protein
MRPTRRQALWLSVDHQILASIPIGNTKNHRPHMADGDLTIRQGDPAEVWFKVDET